jgi:hypothetical protein
MPTTMSTMWSSSSRSSFTSVHYRQDAASRPSTLVPGVCWLVWAGVVRLLDVFPHKGGQQLVLVMEMGECDVDALVRAHQVRQDGEGGRATERALCMHSGCQGMTSPDEPQQPKRPLCTKPPRVPAL